MTYFGFLLRFVVLPIGLLLIWSLVNVRRGQPGAGLRWGWPVAAALFGHSLIALVYTTPWDNYLVATGVWWYDINLVTGITLGWVPIEEYTFFVLQPLLTGLLLWNLMQHLPASNEPLKAWVRPVVLGAVGLVWLSSVIVLARGWQPGTYLGLELVWALPPVMLQLAYGADILWRHRQLVLLNIGLTTLFLSFADSLAIGSGTWTIDPAQSLGVYLAGVLPVEELIFFLLTNVLVTFGVTLLLVSESRERALTIWRRLRAGDGRKMRSPARES